MSIDYVASALGIDESEFQWTDLAACRSLTPTGPENDWFFDAYEEPIARSIDQVCYSCPVIQQCDKYASTNKEEGVWAGYYRTPGGRVDRIKNRHKTPKDWKQLERLLNRKIT